jgi:hypothetical protein
MIPFRSNWTILFLPTIVVTITMEDELCLINWNLIPPFLKEAVEDFPFESTEEAQTFMDLMVSRMRCRLLQAPDVDDLPHLIDEFIDSIQAELVHLADSDFLEADMSF